MTVDSIENSLPTLHRRRVPELGVMSRREQFERTRDRAPWGMLYLAVAMQAVEAINEFVDLCLTGRKLRSWRAFRVVVEDARNADAWLRGVGESSVTVEDVCAWHGQEVDVFVESVYRQWRDYQSELGLLRSLGVMSCPPNQSNARFGVDSLGQFVVPRKEVA